MIGTSLSKPKQFGTQISNDIAMLIAKVYFVNGDYSEIDLPDRALTTIERMRRDECSEREIIQQVITDDWGAPPEYVDFVPGGGAETIRLSYRR